ncbi:MAG: M48 family metallopeptidase, partial [Saezia sp.]
MFQSFFKKSPLKSQERSRKQRLPGSTICFQKTVHLPQGDLTYELQYKQRKTVGIYILAGQVIVRAPHGTDQNRVENFLHEKSSWIRDKLKKQEQKKVQQRVFWGDGGQLTYLGEELALQLNPESIGIVLRPEGVLEIGTARRPRSKETVGADMLVKTWMQKQAIVLFRQKCMDFSVLLGVKPQQITLTSAKSRWGSANSRSGIKLHWRLMQMPHDVIDYVVVHELAHLKEMNHSAQFWSLVKSILPDYAQRRMRLK